MFLNLIYVALGGAIGASLRYLTGIGVVRVIGHGGLWGMPIGVILVNIVGSFLMGVFVVAAAHRGLTHLSPFVMTGVLGGFTTFSAFSLEVVTLCERGQIGTAATYVVLSVALSLGGLVIGLMVARGYWA
jgi:CrcB protein